jgi:hypothetical protein
MNILDDYFGLCPHCHRTNGFINVGPSHWMYCCEHQTKWCIGANLFGSWKSESEADQRAQYDATEFGNYTEVEPYFHPVIVHLPWTRDQLTVDEFTAWVASREQAATAIDIATCELGIWAALDLDPYGLKELLGQDVYQQVGTNRFVRSPESQGWVWEGNLSREQISAMYARINREHGAAT